MSSEPSAIALCCCCRPLPAGTNKTSKNFKNALSVWCAISYCLYHTVYIYIYNGWYIVFHHFDDISLVNNSWPVVRLFHISKLSLPDAKLHFVATCTNSLPLPCHTSISVPPTESAWATSSPFMGVQVYRFRIPRLECYCKNYATNIIRGNFAKAKLPVIQSKFHPIFSMWKHCSKRLYTLIYDAFSFKSRLQIWLSRKS